MEIAFGILNFAIFTIITYTDDTTLCIVYRMIPIYKCNRDIINPMSNSKEQKLEMIQRDYSRTIKLFDSRQ